MSCTRHSGGPNRTAKLLNVNRGVTGTVLTLVLLNYLRKVGLEVE